MSNGWQLALGFLGLLGYGVAALMAIRRGRRPEACPESLVILPLVVGLAAVGGSLVIQIAQGRSLLAVGNVFDAAMMIAWLLAAEVLVIRLAGRLGGVDSLLLPVAAVLQAFALVLFSRRPTSPQYLHQWHILGHVAVISLAGACFVAGGVAGGIYLVVHRSLRRHRLVPVSSAYASLESLERFGRWTVAAGLPLLTFGILTGICGIAHAPPEARGRELLMAGGTFLLWFVYAGGMFVVWLRPRLRGPKAAALACGAAVLTVLNFLVYLVMRSQS